MGFGISGTVCVRRANEVFRPLSLVMAQMTIIETPEEDNAFLLALTEARTVEFEITEAY